MYIALIFLDIAFATQRVLLPLYVQYSSVPETKLAGSKCYQKFVLSVKKRQRAIYFQGSFPTSQSGNMNKGI